MNYKVTVSKQSIIEEYSSFIAHKQFPCIAAKAALSHNSIFAMVAADMNSSEDDLIILDFLYHFIDQYTKSGDVYFSGTVIFKSPINTDEISFDDLLWKKLQALSDLDAKRYNYDPRVSADSNCQNFSFSLKSEALFVIALHPGSSRITRRFKYPALVFNPHQQFEHLRQQNEFERMKQVVRKRDLLYSGSINPMLDDFGASSEALQYSGRKYDSNWKCPLHSFHGKSDNNPTP